MTLEKILKNKNLDQEKKHDQYEQKAWILICIAAFFAVAISMSYFLNFHGGVSLDNSDWGTFGDFIGGILNPIFGFLGLIALLWTINLQIKELEATRQELENTRQELTRAAKAQENSEILLRTQTKTQTRQQFENTFFALLNQHNASLDVISGMMRSQNYNNVNVDQVIRTALHQPIIKANKDLKKYDYLWGSYFRLLYQLLKFLFINYPATSSDHEQKRFFSEDNIKTEVDLDEKMYSNIIRSFLNHQVTQVLAVNCHDKSYIRYKLLLERYAFLEHMPFKYHAEEPELQALNDIKPFYDDRAFGENKFK